MSEFLSANAGIIEAKIRANRLFDLPDDHVFPYFDGLSIVNTAQTVLNIFGVDVDTPLDPIVWNGEAMTGIERVVLFLTDGLSYLLLQDFAKKHPDIGANIQNITEGRGVVPLSSISPSTTVAAMTSYWTAVAPSVHGVTGTLLHSPEHGGVVNMLFSRTILERQNVFLNPATFIPVPSVAQRLAENDVETHLVISDYLIDTALSRLLYRGAGNYHGYDAEEDKPKTVWEMTERALRETRGKRAYVSVYLPDVDAISHVSGASSKKVQKEVREQFAQLAKLIQKARHDDTLRDGKTLFIITADHGHLTVDKRIMLHDNIRSAMRIPLITNDPRMAVLHLHPDTLEAVKQALAEHHSDTVHYIDTESAINAGLYGNANSDGHHPRLRERLGDIILFAADGYIFDDPHITIDVNGMHTGLHEIEMLVPFMYTRF